jgi:hypothetical protein
VTSQRRRHSLLYDLYVGSSLWRLRRFLWWVRSDRRCERCGRPVVLHARRGDVARSVTVHHLTYARLGRERRSDVALICWPCHYAVQRGAPLRIPRSRQPWA